MLYENYQERGQNNRVVPDNPVQAGTLPHSVKIISIIVTAGLMVMLLMAYMPSLSQWTENLLYLVLLALFMYPLLDIFVLAPLRRKISAVLIANNELGETHARNEQHLVKRGEELQRLNDELGAMLKKMEVRESESAVVTEMVNFLHACKTQEETYAVLTSIAVKLFPDFSGSLNIYNASRNFIVNVAHWGEDPEPDHCFNVDECWALRRGSPYQSNVAGMPQCAHFKTKDITAALCIPLIANGTGLGNLVIQTRNKHVSGQLQKFLVTAQTTAEYIALALSNLQLRDRLHRLAIRDPLTGLFNRRYLEETLEREILRAKRRNARFALLVMDVDHFKHFNDSYGHDVGDALLQKLGTLLKNNLRGEDIACRYGGEEFVIVMTDIMMDEARRRADNIRNCTRAITIFDDDKKLLQPVTISIGLVLFPEHGENPETLIKAGDQALYSAKNAGRNRVVCTA